MEEAHRLARVLLVFISSPVKPGATHRLEPTREFEARLVEALTLSKYMEEAWEKGRMLASGRIDARGVELGKLISESMVRSLEASGLEPLAGLHATAILLSAASGYLRGGELSSGLPKALTPLLYRGGPEAAENLLEALDSAGLRELVWRLEERGITRSSVRFHSLALGDVFEALSHVDSGFWLNARTYSRVLEISSRLEGSQNLVEASVRAYLEVLKAMGVEVGVGRGFRALVEADRKLRREGFQGWRALGGAYSAVAIAFDKGLVAKLV
ncbi:MAG: hypothetical protein F7B17_07260 [Desulfurococcales archaeon]|nr:hypothetical protein [Desulfurococcales archaeon]